ncbi:hypothetical protein [Marinobacter sp. CHS3-4]|uniref:hypothetical protein n=1 Tax=Marinobacter sp. CHS3-4 TaxID=3045174 RepID=UPI0024B5DE81|nr:hypothetical protein [Marinobacter sp. CHS3-4]MDI9246368.1 hypothetical protein [Marinobacter sp. CHS3-4]
MSKKPAQATLTRSAIEEQTAAFLKAGGTIEVVGKGRSGQGAADGPKKLTTKAR